MDSFQQFRKVMCARCGKSHRRIKAKTIAGAITKATLECNGIIQTASGPVTTMCATGLVDTGE